MFDGPGKATGWGVAGCVLCYVFAGAGIGWALAITVATALAGCWQLCMASGGLSPRLTSS